MTTYSPPDTALTPPRQGAAPASSAHDAAAVLALGRLSHRLAAQVDVDHEHRRVVLEPPEPGRRALRSQ